MILCDIHRSGDVIYVSDVAGPHVVYLTDDDGNILTTESGEWLSSTPVEYRGDVVECPSIKRSIPDVFYGVAGIDSVTIRLANGDNGIDDTWDEIAAAEELRGCKVVLRDGSENLLMTGVITNYTLGLESSITVESKADQIFETLLPKGVVTTDIFDTTAMDVGAPIPILFGHVKNVPCPNIQNDTGNNEYDYLIGYGPVESLWIDHANGRGIRRNGVLVAESEYTFYDGSQGSPYSGYSFIRFTTEQLDFNNSYMDITADVYGLELGGSVADRNFANVIKAIINSSTWGLNQSVNAASFTAAASALTTASWMCDRAIYEQEQARDILNDMLLVCRSWLTKNSDGEWTITVDGTGSSVATFGENDGYYDNCEVLSCGVTPAQNAIKTGYVMYDNESLQISLACNTAFGVDNTYRPKCVLENATAEKLLSYVYGRAIYADKKLSLKCGKDARDVNLGQVITINAAYRGLSSAEYRVTDIEWNNLEYILDCEAYNASIFDDQSISAPTTRTEQETSTHGLQIIDSGTVGGWTADGSTLANGTNIVLDAENKKIYINDGTFGNSGIQIDYNGGTPRFYVGNGSTKFLKFDGTDTTGNFSGVVNMASQGGCNVIKTLDTQIISKMTYTVIDWDTEEWDTQNEFNMTNNRYTMAQDGKIFISVQAKSYPNTWLAGETFQLAIFVNGAIRKLGVGRTNTAGSLLIVYSLLSAALTLDKDDYIEIKVIHNRTSGDQKIALFGSSDACFASFQKIA